MTEESKWTPGPWHVNGGNAALPDGREIPCWTDADARLIAAAPDMAELLEREVREHDQANNAWGHDSTMVISDTEFIAAARNLLSRIKGEPADG